MGCGNYESWKESLELHTHRHTLTSLMNLQSETAFGFLSLDKEAIIFFWMHKPKSRIEVTKLSIPVQGIFPFNHNITRSLH